MDATDLADMLNVCKAKLGFVTDVFSQDHATDFRFSEDGMCGLYYILSDIEGELAFVVNELTQTLKEEVRCTKKGQ